MREISSIGDARDQIFWSEPAFRAALLWAGLGAGMLALLSRPESAASAGAVLLPLLLLAVAHVASLPAGSSQKGTDALARGVAFGLLGVALPLLAGLGAALLGAAPGPRVGVALTLGAAILALPAVAALEDRPEPGVPPRSSRAPLVAAAAWSFAMAPLVRPALEGSALAFGAALAGGIGVGVAGALGGSLLSRLRFRSHQAPRAAAAGLILGSGSGMAAAALAWF